MGPIGESVEVPAIQPECKKFPVFKVHSWPATKEAIAALLMLMFTVAPLYSREHKTRKEDYGLGYSTEISAPESEVLEAVDEVVNNGKIEGSKEYNKDKFIDNAFAASSAAVFEEWKGKGKVFYKVRERVLAPMNFKESADEGTLAVRYIVQSKTAQQTILRIDALFIEDFRRTIHPSNGSVESAEYKEVQDHVDASQLQKKQAAENERHRQELLAKQALERKKEEAEEMAQASSETLQQHVENLRRQLERLVKAPGAELKSAPFHSATSLKSLNAGTEVVILVVTPYWYGIETDDGQHGWINRAQVEALP
jgi:hypothetical protein